MEDEPTLPSLLPAAVGTENSDGSWWLGAKGRGYLYYFLDQSLVSPSFGSLQATDILSNPGDEGKLDSLAHGIAGGESDKAEQPHIVCGGKKGTKGLKPATSLPSPLQGEPTAPKHQGKALILCSVPAFGNQGAGQGSALCPVLARCALPVWALPLLGSLSYWEETGCAGHPTPQWKWLKYSQQAGQEHSYTFSQMIHLQVW